VLYPNRLGTLLRGRWLDRAHWILLLENILEIKPGVGGQRESVESLPRKRYLEAGAQRGPLHREALRWFFVAYACHGLPGNRRAEPAGPLSDAALAGSTEARRGTATPPYNGKAGHSPFDQFRVPSEVEGRAIIGRKRPSYMIPHRPAKPYPFKL